MRADARKNYEHLLAIAREAVAEHGAETSLRDIARRADVGMGTLYRHFPTRDALLEALLRTSLDALAQQADDLEGAAEPGAALMSWFYDALAFTRTHNGVVTVMAEALDDEASALHASCSKVRAAGARLLERAQDAGVARSDIDGTDLFALMGALAWTGEQPAFALRTGHLAEIIAFAICNAR
jgi:AcrR family transcriptional regulator